ncbi:MAG: glycosyltransferase [Calditrichaceae bacterium]|nr:glycosyltransferase [Calditrichaceae bacterium]MBN2708876.1 glycosyltransferase [Calditrichaceae bacterium]RQV97598.1 MAG: glycosyltransferase [Calditrichota bacterium]
MMTDNIDISIIIPTLNEESTLGDCLNAVFAQDGALKTQVIIADFNSADKTIEICQGYPVKIITGGLPAVARNSGAKNAAGKYLLFLDADTIIPVDFLSSALPAFSQSGAIIASFFLKPKPDTFLMKVIFNLYNEYGWLASRLTLPVFVTAGCCLLVKKSDHEAVDGFDEDMAALEEYEYIRKLKKKGRFRVLPLKVITSTRRFSKGNGFKKTIILFNYYFKWLLGKKIPQDKYGYWEK